MRTLRVVAVVGALTACATAAAGPSALAVATAAAGDAAGACAVTGDGRARVAVRCTGQPEFEAQVIDAIGTLPPNMAIALDEEVATPGYGGKARGSLAGSLAWVAFTPPPSVALARVTELEAKLRAVTAAMAELERVKADNADLRNQLTAARALKVDAAARGGDVLTPQSDYTVIDPVKPEGERLRSDPELEAMKAELAATLALANSETKRLIEARAAATPQVRAAPPREPAAPTGYYVRLDEDAKAPGERTVELKAGGRAKVIGPYRTLDGVAEVLAGKGIYPLSFLGADDIIQ